MTSRAGSNQGPWQIKRVSSTTGPVGSTLSDAIRYDAIEKKVIRDFLI